MPRKKTSKVLLRVGGPGHWVSVVQRANSPNLYLRFWNPTRGNYEWTALKHADVERADAEARDAAAGLLQATEIEAGAPVTLAYLFARYEQEITPTKSELQQREDRRRIAIWQAHLGADFDVLELNVGHLKSFEVARRAGKLTVEGLKLRRVRNRSVQADESFLSAVLTWASSIDAGVRLVPYNPMARYRKPRELNPRRPRTSYDAFLAVDGKADEVDPQRLFRGLHALVEALGWRVSAICQLRARDLDLRRFRKVAPHGRILKREETDKVGVEQWVPLSKAARAAVDLVLERNPVVGEAWLFPAPRSKKRAKSWTRHHARKLLLAAYEAAEVELEERVGFHAYRRKWADERKHLPRTDVAAAGAWLSTRTLDIYEQPDQETLLAVVNEPRKLRRPKAVPGGEQSSFHSRDRSTRRAKERNEATA